MKRAVGRWSSDRALGPALMGAVRRNRERQTGRLESVPPPIEMRL